MTRQDRAGLLFVSPVLLGTLLVLVLPTVLVLLLLQLTGGRCGLGGGFLVALLRP